MNDDGKTYSAKGTNGILKVNATSIELVRNGFRNKLLGLRGDKEVSLKDITSIQFKKPGMLTNGFIQFSFAGSNERRGGTFNATTDENSIVFSKSKLRQFEQLKDLINHRRNTTNSSQSSQPTPPNSNYDQLEKLAELRDKGIISDDEFNMKKKQILGI